jgi:release factor glutamine methyltransferase
MKESKSSTMRPEITAAADASSRKSFRGTTLHEALAWGQSQLKVLGKTEARASAERLLEEVLGCDRMRLYMDAHRPIPAKALGQFKRLIASRSRRIPLDYLFGRCHFWNEVLEVGPGCLIPRPSTEVLVERFIENAGFKKEDRFSFLDLGCGSGAIGLSLLRHFPNAKAVFSDMSPKALEITRRNLRRYGLLKRARLVRSNLFAAFKKERWDAVISNPPYLSANDLKVAQPEILKEPRLALDGGKDGYFFYRRILQEAPQFLNSRGILVLEMGKGQARKLKRWCSGAFRKAAIYKDYAKIDRILIAGLDG